MTNDDGEEVEDDGDEEDEDDNENNVEYELQVKMIDRNTVLLATATMKDIRRTPFLRQHSTPIGAGGGGLRRNGHKCPLKPSAASSLSFQRQHRHTIHINDAELGRTRATATRPADGRGEVRLRDEIVRKNFFLINKRKRLFSGNKNDNGTVAAVEVVSEKNVTTTGGGGGGEMVTAKLELEIKRQDSDIEVKVVK